MASNKNDNIRLLAPKPIDERYLHPSNRPWNSVSEALNGITYRAPYLWVVIAGKLYWFQGGVGDEDLVEFLPEIDIPEIVNNLTTNDSSKTLGADMGVLLKSYIDAINEILTSDDTSLDELQEIVDYIKQNKEILETLAISNIAGLQTALDQLQTNIDLKQDKLNTDGTIEILNDGTITHNLTTYDYTVLWSEGESKVFTMPLAFYEAEVYQGSKLVNRTPDQYWRYIGDTQIEIIHPLVGENVEVTFKLHRKIIE